MVRPRDKSVRERKKLDSSWTPGSLSPEFRLSTESPPKVPPIFTEYFRRRSRHLPLELVETRDHRGPPLLFFAIPPVLRRAAVNLQLSRRRSSSWKTAREKEETPLVTLGPPRGDLELIKSN